jgi:hypothetical protein
MDRIVEAPFVSEVCGFGGKMATGLLGYADAERGALSAET